MALEPRGVKLERQLTSQCSGGRRWRVGCGGAGAVGDIRPMLPRSLREPVPLPLRRLRPCPPTACVEGNRLGGREGGCAICSKVRHQYCGNFEGNFFSHCAKISAAIGLGRCVKYSVTLLGYILVLRHLLPAHRHCFFGGKYILACWIHCVDPVIWFVWSAVSSRHNQAIWMTACERSGSASFTVKEPNREKLPDGGSYWSPEFCAPEFVPDAAGVAGVTHGGFLVSTLGS